MAAVLTRGPSTVLGERLPDLRAAADLVFDAWADFGFEVWAGLVFDAWAGFGFDAGAARSDERSRSRSDSVRVGRYSYGSGSRRKRFILSSRPARSAATAAGS